MLKANKLAFELIKNLLLLFGFFGNNIRVKNSKNNIYVDF